MPRISDAQGNELKLNANGSISTVGNLAKEPFAESDLTIGEYTFAQEMNGFDILNNGLANLTFTIAGDTYTVKPNQGRRENFVPFTVVAIASTGALSFEANGLL